MGVHGAIRCSVDELSRRLVYQALAGQSTAVLQWCT